jgi:hypothetical protein
LALLLIIAPTTIIALKGQWVLLAAGFLTLGLVWVIVALRLARLKSWWARRVYGPEKLVWARARYGT